ncbi:MAG: pyridoxine 5'-phosphate synthase [Planctomycetota bacterium]|nr:pyridoxine 5'-phosphate synthase [Planctomycetota bacterium]
MAGLGVNIDHVATVRQARRTVEPDPILAAAEAVLGGADCITFHLRVDRRHINDRDARLLKQTVRAKLNMEMSMDAEIVDIALDLKPDQATLVPEKRQEVTTEGGLDAVAHAARLAEVTAALQKAGIVVSAFIDPELKQIQASKQAGCDAVEIHTGRYANAFLLHGGQQRAEKVKTALEEIHTGLTAGLDAGLTVHGGHGLTYQNIAPVAAMEGFDEFNIGHSIIARAVFTGLREAVAEMKRLTR